MDADSEIKRFVTNQIRDAEDRVINEMLQEEKKCPICEEMTKQYLQTHPEKRGRVICESCYEKSKEFFSYMNFPYMPDFIFSNVSDGLIEYLRKKQEDLLYREFTELPMTTIEKWIREYFDDETMH